MGLHKIIANLRPESLKIGPYHALKISHERALHTIDANQIDAFLVDNEQVISAVMSHDELYLKPLFYIGSTKKQCDGMINAQDLSPLIAKIEILLQGATQYQNLSLPSDPSKRLLTKIMRYILSRKKILAPVNTRDSKIGYGYPLVQEMSIESNHLHIMSRLNDYSAEDYFFRKIVDKVNICYECQSSYLNFGECCSKCNSLDLKTEELVHHFRCAYVGPQSDYIKEEKMVCPKCDHQLKHIGIDYDKPSEIHTCGSCNHSSQETKMKAKCVDCSKDNQLEQLVTFDIYEYHPTEKAMSFAKEQNGQQSLGIKEKQEEEWLLNIGAFQLIKSHESRRTHVNKSFSFELLISVREDLLEKLNQGMRLAMKKELAFIVRPYLKENDLLSIDESGNLLVLLIDYSQDDLEKLHDVLDFNLNKMLSDNGWSEKQAVFISNEKLG